MHFSVTIMAPHDYEDCKYEMDRFVL